MTRQQFFPPRNYEEEIEKAVRYIKVNQFHAGFPEIAQPGRGGDIEVTIKSDTKADNLFHVMFRFVTIPGCKTIFKELKVIDSAELGRLAAAYDDNKAEIDQELADRNVALNYNRCGG